MGLVISRHADECKNTSTGQSWCGYCALWECEYYGIKGKSMIAKTLTDEEIEKLLEISV